MALCFAQKREAENEFAVVRAKGNIVTVSNFYRRSKMNKSKFMRLMSLIFIFTVSSLVIESAFAWRPLSGDWSIETPKPPKIKNPVKTYDYCVIIQNPTESTCIDCKSRGVGGEGGKVYCAKTTAMSGEGGTVRYGSCNSGKNYDLCQGVGSNRYNY